MMRFHPLVKTVAFARVSPSLNFSRGAVRALSAAAPGPKVRKID
jgi:hypothetical protein